MELNPFALIAPNSIRIAVETVRYDLEKKEPIAPTRAEFVNDYRHNPNKFIPSVVLMIDVSEIRGPRTVCLYRPYGNTAIIQTDFRFPEWYQDFPGPMPL